MSGAPGALLEIKGLSVRFGGVWALNDLSMRVEAGKIVGLIGPNGAGKTTVLNCISRFYNPASGSLSFRGIDILRRRASQIGKLGIARTFQHSQLFSTMTVFENICTGGHVMAGFVDPLSESLGLPWARRRELVVRRRAREILNMF